MNKQFLLAVGITSFVVIAFFLVLQQNAPVQNILPQEEPRLAGIQYEPTDAYKTSQGLITLNHGGELRKQVTLTPEIPTRVVVNAFASNPNPSLDPVEKTYYFQTFDGVSVENFASMDLSDQTSPIIATARKSSRETINLPFSSMEDYQLTVRTLLDSEEETEYPIYHTLIHTYAFVDQGVDEGNEAAVKFTYDHGTWPAIAIYTDEKLLAIWPVANEFETEYAADIPRDILARENVEIKVVGLNLLEGSSLIIGDIETAIQTEAAE